MDYKSLVTTVVVSAITALIVVVVALMMPSITGFATYPDAAIVPESSIDPKDGLIAEFADWKTYDVHPEFSFMYPPEYKVIENVDPESSDTLNVMIVPLDQGVPPVMQINVHENQSVSFALWEGLAWEDFDTVRRTFTFK